MKVDMQELVDSSMPSIIESFRKELTNKITWQVTEDAAKIVSAHVQEWVKENILPEVSNMLVESKQGLMDIAKEMAPLVIEALVSKMTEDFKKRLENSWDRNEIMKALFKA